MTDEDKKITVDLWLDPFGLAGGPFTRSGIPGKDEDINKLIEEVEDHLGRINDQRRVWLVEAVDQSESILKLRKSATLGSRQ